MTAKIFHDGEARFLDLVVADLINDEPKLVYADWLEEHGDSRAAFLRAFVEAIATMHAADFPSDEGIDPEWKDLIGFDLLKYLAENNAGELKARALVMARPALRLVAAESDLEDEDTGDHSVDDAGDDKTLPIGASKLFGRPDLPDVSAWPKGDHCHAIYNDSCEGLEGPAGFMAQVNLAEIAGIQAGKLLPNTGLLSFFCYQDVDENIDAVGVCARLFPNLDQLQRLDQPQTAGEEEPGYGNQLLPARRLTFVETLDLPTAWSGPWAEDWGADEFDESVLNVKEIVDGYRDRNFDNMLGYGRETSGDEPTPSKESRHLIVLDNAAECKMHIQIPFAELSAKNFDAITLEWVDFD